MNKQMINKVKEMFPNNPKLDQAIDQATEMLQGASPNQAPSILKNIGVTKDGINNIYKKYGSSMQAKVVLGLFGVSPEALKEDAIKMLDGGTDTSTKPTNLTNTKSSNNAPKKYPRLK